ncbi:winged helix-turn-helix transcriptional regulator [Bradyrhizobium sp. INPA01-394B]|uniref:Winged helix-turn-helix transcriptional regulator n=1 Tax=Bradyrhizobium campsiandrae TaxID=1729892 RepID=A0ABR7U640_9BRAD|nr:MarR family transcriptional regulator [Bradyrhizobium campsiandrae]MBC9881661.1 winged helix-turn-helix transcriptional regulator [Bradyrhizobium campsiandrae]MBC9979494.1 winged helix-turn-helix transcriptional regulator [Bradyrhizobium campsiandrae]
MMRKPAGITKSKPAQRASSGGAAVHVPAPGEGKRGEQGYLGYLLRQAHAAVRLKMERSLADLGVTSPQFAVLTMLNAYPGLSGADVARLTFLTPQTVGVIIRNLERDGAIVMTPHPVHGRIQQWTLTPRGSTLLKACRERVIELEKRLASGLDAKAEASIRRWLANVARELQED